MKAIWNETKNEFWKCWSFSSRELVMSNKYINDSWQNARYMRSISLFDDSSRVDSTRQAIVKQSSRISTSNRLFESIFYFESIFRFEFWVSTRYSTRRSIYISKCKKFAKIAHLLKWKQLDSKNAIR